MCLRRHYITPFLLKDGCIYSEVWNMCFGKFSSIVQSQTTCNKSSHHYKTDPLQSTTQIPHQQQQTSSKCLASWEMTRSSRRVTLQKAQPVWPKLGRVVSPPPPPPRTHISVLPTPRSIRQLLTPCSSPWQHCLRFDEHCRRCSWYVIPSLKLFRQQRDEQFVRGSHSS